MEWSRVNPGDAAIPASGGSPMVSTTSASCGLGARLANAPGVPSVFGSVDSLAGAMTFHRERQAVLSGNIGNLETPNYRPLDLERVVLPTAPGADPAQPVGAGPAPFQLVFDDGGALNGPDGNAVTPDRELAKMDANRVRYNTSAELVTRRLALLRYAAGDGVG